MAEPLRAVVVPRDKALARAEALLEKLNVPQALWDLSPTTFSGGEQQRVNIARGFVYAYPAMLLDEPTAGLDAASERQFAGLMEAHLEGGGIVVAATHVPLHLGTATDYHMQGADT